MNNLTGNANVAIGWHSLLSNTSGVSNAAGGAGSLFINTSGRYNTGFGVNTLANNSNGTYNVGLGIGAGNDNFAGDHNTFIGGNADANGHDLNYAAAIGSSAVVSASNSMVLGGTGSAQVKVGIGSTAPLTDLDIKQDDASGNERGLKLERADNTDDWRIFIGGCSNLGLAFNNATVGIWDSGAGLYTPSSDIRLKKDIEALSGILDKVMQLKPKSYRFIADVEQQRTLGFIAQEVEPIFPEIVNEREDGFKGLAYDEFSVIAIQAIQEQQKVIQQQQDVISQLLLRLEALEKK